LECVKSIDYRAVLLSRRPPGLFEGLCLGRARDRGAVDAPWVRMTILAVQAGATLTASKCVPEDRDLVPRGGQAAAAA
jgi:hypothetical protein